jgi:hypothetical protein
MFMQPGMAQKFFATEPVTGLALKQRGCDMTSLVGKPRREGEYDSKHLLLEVLLVRRKEGRMAS